MRLGLERLLDGEHQDLIMGRFALLANQASVDRQFEYSAASLSRAFPGRLASILSPQHGFFSEQQDNMIETPHGHDLRLGVPIHSLYSETRRPTPAMLADTQTIVIDLQDVGTRVYTFVWSALACLEVAAERGLRVVVLDRPNPIGNSTEGPALDPAFRSFVGMAPIPMRHGLTIGELMRWCQTHFKLAVELDVIPMSDYDPAGFWPTTGLDWVPTSPNLPRFEGVVVYPGQVLIEGTRLSEGRGTTTPFELFGHPRLDPFALVDRLNQYQLPGFVARPIRFEPTFQKHARLGSGGAFLHVTDVRTFAPLKTTVALLACCRELLGDAFEWLPPPYEYEATKMPIDILWGNVDLRTRLARGETLTPQELADLTAAPADWLEQTKSARLY